jgi:hypothetical protein
MKTPREILLQHHRAAEPRLDEIRRTTIAQLEKPSGTRAERLPLRALFTLWRELIWPCRRTWATLAAVWLLMLVMNVSLRDPGQATLANSSPSRGMMLALQQQEQLLAELSEPHKSRVATSPPKPAAPRPRSDRSGTIVTT